jgi:hypothetical protein
VICDLPFAVDADSCGSGNVCNCYFGGPLPLSAGNTPACVVNRFAQNLTGTANVDTGEGRVEVHLRSQVFLGESLTVPCPVCGGTCTAGEVGDTCAVNSQCDTSLGAGNGVCGNFDPTPNDGLRGGKCFEGRNENLDCDIDSPNTSFPAPGGGGQSLDCFPKVGLNVSGVGLQIDLVQTTGTQSIASNVPCGQPPSVPRICPCGQCTGDLTIPCQSNADCGASGPCEATAGQAFPNQCAGEACSDTGNGIDGLCTTGPDITSCDGVLRANGDGFISCNGNADCLITNIGIDGGTCSLAKRQSCFLPTINAQGVADPNEPLGVALFCIPRTSNGGINTVAGLPGPGRVINQGSARTFCASNQAVEYQPGVGGCP